MRARQRWLIITHGFDAQDRSSQVVSQRIPHLLEQGVEPFVISSRDGARNRTFPHYQRASWGPTGASELIRVTAKDASQLTRSAALILNPMLLPLVALERSLFGASSEAAWVVPATRTGLALTRNLPFDLIYSSGGAASAHHAAALIKAQTGLPWLAEVLTPMVAMRENASESGLPRRSRQEVWLEKLERRIGNEANLVCFTHPVAMEQAQIRTPNLCTKSFILLPGAVGASTIQPEEPGQHRYTDKLNLCHFGDVVASSSMVPLVRAIDLLRTAHPGVEKNIQIKVFGKIRDPATIAALKANRLESLITQHSGQASRWHQSEMSAADCLLLIQGQTNTCRATAPLQIYDFLAARRPIMAITCNNHFLDKLVADHAGYIAHTSRDDTIKAALVHLIADWHAKRLPHCYTQPVTVEAGVLLMLDRIQTADFFEPGQTEST